MTDLCIETNADFINRQPAFRFPDGGVMLVTPPVGESYWLFRVCVGYGQAVIGFPKFSTIGIGFAKEDDWNTNLPYTCESLKIWNHIKHNKGDDRISDETCIEAIGLIQVAAAAYKTGSL